LETEEEIAKWIEERKRKWPGNKNKELRLQRELKRKAYEAASPAVNSSQTSTSKKVKQDRPKGVAQHPDGYQRAPRVWGQAVPEGTTPSSLATDQKPDISDDESEAANVVAFLTQDSKRKQSESMVPQDASMNQDLDGEALLPLPTEAQSAKNDFPRGSDLKEHLHVAEMEEDSDHDSAPEEVEFSHEPTDVAGEDQEELRPEKAVQTEERAMREQVRHTCNSWTATGTCKFGKQCRYEHDPAKRGKPRHEPPPVPNNPFERGDLIGKLVHHEVRHEVSDLSQVIDFLARNDWLRHVELYPGHKAELEGQINEVGP
jgi:hypothetical protein